MMKRPGYLKSFWSSGPSDRDQKVWFSLFTPQVATNCRKC